jgi:UDP-N-acetylglucosamine 2-epimerase (hydrolysing)
MTPARRRIVFITGTRADFGKLKSLLNILYEEERHDVHLFVTGMHMLAKYGYTCGEVERCGYRNIHKFINQNYQDTMDTVLAKTIGGFSDYVKEIRPDLIVVHGDRVETLAGAIVGALNNILVAHIEGGEVSGTVDELLRHAVSKMSHLHFVANDEAKARLLQLGERTESIFVIGSPDIDIMVSPTLPSLGMVRDHYELPATAYGIVMLHPVTTELALTRGHARTMVDFLLADDLSYVVIYPNNDAGAELILEEYARLTGHPRFRVIPSMRFEYFLTLMRHAALIIGNSSAGVREAPFYGVPSINLGTRQANRADGPTILDTPVDAAAIAAAAARARSLRAEPSVTFGTGESNRLFNEALGRADLWSTSPQKQFIDYRHAEKAPDTVGHARR